MLAHTLDDKRSRSDTLARVLRHGILDGKFSRCEPLPSLRTLSDRHGVGVQIVRNALSVLEKEGIIYRRERVGTFIRLASDSGEASQPTAALRCVNFLERPMGTTPGFVRTGYLQGYTEVLEHLDIKMRILAYPYGDTDCSAVFSPKYTFQEQGCILINLLSAPLMQWLNDHRIPFVVQNYTSYAKADLPPHHSVYINKMHAGFEATRHLLAAGHRRIGFVGVVAQDGTSAHQVYGGFEAAMRHSGLDVMKANVLDLSTNEIAMAVEPVRVFLDRSDPPTALVAANDAMALAALEAARQLKRRVPEDLSVVGFDDLPEAEESQPPLTTVANPRTLLGRTAIEMLLDASTGKFTEPQARALEGCLVVRGSTAGPSGR